MRRYDPVQRARIERKRAACSHEFGEGLALRWFGLDRDAIVARFGVYQTGPRKGLPRGEVVWAKVLEGGWVRGYGVLHPAAKIHCIVSADDANALNRLGLGEYLAAVAIFDPSRPAPEPTRPSAGGDGVLEYTRAEFEAKVGHTFTDKEWEGIEYARSICRRTGGCAMDAAMAGGAS